MFLLLLTGQCWANTVVSHLLLGARTIASQGYVSQSEWICVAASVSQGYQRAPSKLTAMHNKFLLETQSCADLRPPHTVLDLDRTVVTLQSLHKKMLGKEQLAVILNCQCIMGIKHKFVFKSSTDIISSYCSHRGRTTPQPCMGLELSNILSLLYFYFHRMCCRSQKAMSMPCFLCP